MSSQKEILAKRLDRIQIVTVLSVISSLAWLIWVSKNSNEDVNIKFWFSTSISFVSLMEALFSLKRGYGWAKGGKIEKEIIPTLFTLNVAFSFLLTGIGLLGILYYI